MTTHFIALASAAFGLVAVAVGWGLNEFSAAVRRHESAKDGLGEALAELLEIRHRLAAKLAASEELGRLLQTHVGFEEEDGRNAMHQVLQAVWPEFGVDSALGQRLDRALDKLAGQQPVLAHQLRRLDAILGLGPKIATLVEDGDEARIAFRFERTVSGKFIEQLETSIRQLAVHHGRSTAKLVEEQLKRPAALPDGFANVVNSYFQELGLIAKAQAP